MTTRGPRLTGGALAVVLFSGIGYGVSRLPALGAGGLLHPIRRHADIPRPASCEDATFTGRGVTLKGWRCQPSGTRRGTVVYLHGIADNRASGVGVVERFVKRQFDVVAYDSRAHGESGGDACTYGYFEKQDLRQVVNQIEAGPVVLIGTSLGAAVALQAAADDPRISAVVAAESFSDLRTVASERAPFFFTPGALARAFALAEQQGAFEVDAVSAVQAARTIAVPVLLIHGEADVDTPPLHSRRIFAAIRGPKQLLIVPGAGHNGSLRGGIWRDIEQWIDDVLASARPPADVPGVP